MNPVVAVLTTLKKKKPTAIKHGDSAFSLFSDLGEYFVPIGSTSDGAWLKAGDQVAFFL